MTVQKKLYHQYFTPEFPLHIGQCTKIDRETEIINRNNAKFYIIHYTYEGAGKVIISGTKYLIKKNDVFILPKDSHHELYPDAKNPWSRYWLSLGGKLVDNLFLGFSLQGICHFSAPKLESKFAFFLKLENYLNNRKTFQKKAIHGTNDLFQAMFYAVQESKQVIYSKEITNIIHLLDRNIDTNRSIKDIEKDFPYSAGYISRVFKQETGITPYEYILQKKCETACYLVKLGTMKIKEISDLLGFRDQYHFSNFFKQRTGKRPRDYQIER